MLSWDCTGEGGRGKGKRCGIGMDASGNVARSDVQTKRKSKPCRVEAVEWKCQA